MLSELLGPMKIVDKKSVAYISKLHAAFNFLVEMSRVQEVLMYI